MSSSFRIARLWMKEYVSFFDFDSHGYLSGLQFIGFFFDYFFYVVFRREPLWKVSMNIRVHPTVRCSYVAEENILRIVLREAVGGTGNVGPSAPAESSDLQTGTGDAVQNENTNQEVVVYALKVRTAFIPFDFFLKINKLLAWSIMFET